MAYSVPVGAISYNTATMQLTLYSTSFADRGLFNFRLTGTNSIRTYYTDFTVDITVTSCYYAVIADTAITAITYQVNSTSASYTLAEFSNNDTTCPITYSLSINSVAYTGATGAFTFNSATRLLTLYSSSVTDNGIFTLRLTGTNGVWTDYVDFTVTISVSPCYYAVIANTPITALTYQVNGTSTSYTLPAFTNNDTTCPITYTLTINGAAYTAPVGAISYTTSTRVLTLYSTSVTAKGLFNLRLTGTNGIWTDYADFTVDVTVTLCYYAVIANTPIAVKTY